MREKFAAKLARIAQLVAEGRRAIDNPDDYGPNYVRVTLSEIEEVAKVPDWPI